jgi:dienelactone hydrolase
LRALAAIDSSSRTAELLLTIADSYVEKAAAAEAIEQTHHGFLNDEFDTRETETKDSGTPIWGGGTALCGKHHIGVLFHSADEKYEALLPFIKEAFDLGHEAIHVVDPNLRNDHRRRLTHAGIDIARSEQSGQFELHDWTGLYLCDGRFDKDRVLASVRSLVETSRQQGYGKIHAIGNMGWALQAHTSMDDLMEYEARVNQIWPDDGGAAFCAYDLAKFNGATIVNVIRTHPLIMIDGAIHENPHYVPPG